MPSSGDMTSSVKFLPIPRSGAARQGVLRFQPANTKTIVDVRSRFDSPLFDALAMTVIGGHYVYVLVFNSASEEARLAFTGGMLVAQVFLAVSALVLRPALWSQLIAAALVIKLGCWTISILSGAALITDHAELLRLFSRQIAPYIAAIWLLSWVERMPSRLVLGLAVLSFGIASIWALVGQAVLVGGSYRLGTFTGGEGTLGLHSSAFFIATSFLLFDRLRALKRLSPTLAWPLIAVALVLIAGYGVRTTVIMLAAYFVGEAWAALSKRFVAEIGLLAIAAALIAIAGVLIFVGTPPHIEEWGSGRVGSYIFRYQLLAERDLLPWLVGTGPSSDTMVTPIWYWSAKDSHSDLLTTLVEAGILGLFGVVLFFAALWRRLKAANFPLVLGLVVSSAISNGFLARPTEFFFLLLTMAVAEHWRVRQTPARVAYGGVEGVRIGGDT